MVVLALGRFCPGATRSYERAPSLTDWSRLTLPQRVRSAPPPEPQIPERRLGGIRRRDHPRDAHRRRSARRRAVGPDADPPAPQLPDEVVTPVLVGEALR